MYQVPIAAGAFGTVKTGPTLALTTTPCSPVTDILNPNASAGPTEWIYASAETEGIAAGCSGGCVFNFNDTPWLPLTAYTVGQEVLDTNLHVEVVSTAGTSGASVTWNPALGGTTMDGTVHWLDQGALTAPVLSGWTASHHYAKGTEILDPAVATLSCQQARALIFPAATIPTFNATPGGTTIDGISNMDERGRDCNRRAACGRGDEWHYRRQHCWLAAWGLANILLDSGRSGLWNLGSRRVRGAGVAIGLPVAACQYAVTQLNLRGLAYSLTGTLKRQHRRRSLP